MLGDDASSIAAALRERGAKAIEARTFDEIDASARFDLVVLEDFGERLGEALVAAKGRLEDGGHVLANAAVVSGYRDLAEAAGLELLRVDYGGRFASAAGSPFVSEYLAAPIERVVKGALPEVFNDELVLVARRRPAPGRLSLTVGMLALDEEESMAQMIDDIRGVAPDANILVVDSSSDRTPEIAREKGARVVRQLPPRGHGPAMERLMYEAASESEALIYLDCDFTYPTREIVRLREELERGADMVNASRTSKYPKAMPVPNFVANRFFAGLAHAVHGVPTTDVHSGMRAYRTSMIRAFDFDGEGDALPLDTLIFPARSGYRVVELPIEYNERVGVSKLAKIRGTVWTFLRTFGAIGRGKRVGRGAPYVIERG